MTTMTKEEMKQALLDLNEKIWVEKLYAHQFKRGYRDSSSNTYWQPVRALSKEEWQLVVDCVKSGFPATICGFGYFSEFVLAVFQPLEPMYPGLEGPDFEPRLLIQVTGRQYPGNNPTKAWNEQKLPSSADYAGGVFDIFESICKDAHNLALLDKDKIDRPKPRSYYQY